MLRKLGIIAILWITSTLSLLALVSTNPRVEGDGLLLPIAPEFTDRTWRDIYYARSILATALTLLNIEERAAESLEEVRELDAEAVQATQDLLFRVLLEDLDFGLPPISTPFLKDFLSLLHIILRNRNNLEIMEVNTSIRERIQHFHTRMLSEPRDQFPVLAPRNRRLLRGIRFQAETLHRQIVSDLNTETHIDHHTVLASVLDYFERLLNYMYEVRACSVRFDVYLVDQMFALQELESTRFPPSIGEDSEDLLYGYMRDAFHAVFIREFVREQAFRQDRLNEAGDRERTEAMRTHLRSLFLRLLEPRTMADQVEAIIERDGLESGEFLTVLIEDADGNVYMETGQGRHYLPCNCTTGRIQVTGFSFR